MFLRVILPFVAVGAICILIGMRIKENDIAKQMLWLTYQESAHDILHDTLILEELRSGDSKKAISHLENRLEIDAAVASGCTYDLCKDQKNGIIEEALKASNTYQRKYMEEQNEKQTPNK